MNVLEPYTTTKEDLVLLAKMSFGKRMKWIRDKANELNRGEFSINELANKADIAVTSLSRIESGDSQDTKSLILIKLAKCLSVPTDVFHDPYYEGVPRSFTICGVAEPTRNWELTDVAYKAHLRLISYSPQNVQLEEVDEEIGLSPLEYEEFINEVKQLLAKVKRRRITWNKKIGAYKQLTTS